MAPTILECLQTLGESHARDGDGGYALIDAILSYAKSLHPAEQAVLYRELVRLVDLQHPTLWGVALECLVQLEAKDVSAELYTSLTQQRHDAEWEQFVLFALTRLGYRPVLDRAVKNAEQRFADEDYTAVLMVAAVSRLDIDACMATMTTLMLELFERGSLSQLQNFVPGVVMHFAKVDPELVRMLIQRLVVAEPAAAQQCERLFCEYVCRPHAVGELGSQTVDRIKNWVCSDHLGLS